MKKHPYRTFIVWATLVISIILIVPTAGWMLTPSDPECIGMSDAQLRTVQPPPEPGTREGKRLKWLLEDDERAKERPGYFTELWHEIVRWAEFDRENVINLGLDLQGGIHMVLGFDWQDLPEEKKTEYLTDNSWEEGDLEKHIQETILQKIIRRANEFDAKEPIIQALGNNQIQIQLPGEKNIERARNLITMTAKLDFHIVAGQDEAAPVWAALEKDFPDEMSNFVAMVPGQITREVNAENYERVRLMLDNASKKGIIPEDKMVTFSVPPKPYQPQIYNLYILQKEPIASGEGITQAYAAPNPQSPSTFQILFSLGTAAGAEFGEATEQNLERAMAIVVDGLVLSAPTIQARIDTSGQITGDFSPEEARDLGIALNSGSMAVPIREEFTNVIGPSLGADSVRAGVISGIVGVILVGAFMILYYRVAGVIAVLALIFNGLFIIAAMAYFNMTLTLPGIAGLILTIGMAVDANVLIYERMREELKRGHTLLASIDSGFSRAAVTILDANITTLIASAVLFQFGTGPIEGFAVTLCIGILGTIFSALVVSRALFDLAYSRHLLGSLKMMSIIRGDLNIKFMEVRRPAISLSIILVAIGLSMFTYRTFQGNMYGVDFTQGTNLTLKIDNPEHVSVNDVRLALAEAGFDSPIVQETGDATGEDVNTYLVRVSDIDEIKAVGGASAAPATDTAPDTSTQQDVSPAGDAPAQAASSEEEILLAQETTPAEADEAAPVPAEPAAVETPAEQPAEVIVEAGEPASEPAPAPEATPEATPPATDATEEITPLPAEGLTTVAQRIEQALAPLTASGQASSVIVESEQTVGPAAGTQLRNDAIKSIFWSLIFIIIYLAFRFELKFALGAVVAVVHDVLVTVGVLALLGREIDMNVIAALLTIVGYSLNDTIVIFDRVREDLQLYRGRGYTFPQLLNIALNATLSRTILTSLTVLFVVIVLLIFGGDALRDFALALTIGVVAGTYSTIYIASPVVYAWQVWRGKDMLAGDATPGKGTVPPRHKKKRPTQSKGATA